MRDLIDRWNVAVRINATSSAEFATRGTTLVSMIAAPLLSLLFVVGLAASLRSQEIVTTAYAAVLINGVVSMSTAVASGVMRARQGGLIVDTMGRCLARARFWLPTAAAPAGANLVMGWVSALGVFALDARHESVALAACVALIPVALVVGTGVGVFAGGLGLLFADPYLVANVLSGLLVITAGVIAPLDTYPQVAGAICAWLPGSGTVAAFRELVARPWGTAMLALVQDIGVALLLGCAGILASRLILRAVRAGRRTVDVFSM